MNGAGRGRGRADRLGLTLGMLASLATHGAVVLYLSLSGPVPELGIRFQLPSEVEFGLTEEVEVLAPPAGTVSPSAQAAASPTPADHAAGDEHTPDGETPDGGVPARDAGTDAGRSSGEDAGGDAGWDAGKHTGETDRALVASGDPDLPPAGDEATDEEPDDTPHLPPGASIAIRIDMERIRRSTLAQDVRRFVQHNPHWRALFAGSGVDPVDDFQRLMIASPNLMRERVLFAGRATGGEAAIRAMVERMAETRGVDAGWHDVDGAPSATWANGDDTARVATLVGPAHFTITRPEDLPRLMAVARVRAARESEEGRQGQEAGDEASALLSMGARDYFSIEWEGYRRFFRGPAIPRRMVGHILEGDGGRVELDAMGEYDSAEQAEQARAFWERVRAAYSRDVGVLLIGLGGPLRSTRITTQGAKVLGRVSLSPAQVRLGLALLGPLLADFERRYGGHAAPPVAATRGASR